MGFAWRSSCCLGVNLRSPGRTGNRIQSRQLSANRKSKTGFCGKARSETQQIVGHNFLKSLQVLLYSCLRTRAGLKQCCVLWGGLQQHGSPATSRQLLNYAAPGLVVPFTAKINVSLTQLHAPGSEVWESQERLSDFMIRSSPSPASERGR